MTEGGGALAPRKGKLNIGGVQLEFQHWAAANPDLPTLVLLHEGLGCVAMWRDFPQRLAKETGAGVFCYSRAGYGGSDPVSLPRHVRYMHDEALQALPQVLAAAELEKFLLVGHSDGGTIALIYAGELRPASLLGAVLMAPHVFVENVSVQSIAKARELYETTDLRSRLARYHGDRVDDTFYGWNDVWLSPAFRSWTIEEYLPGVACPLLLIQGQNDEYGTLEQLERIVAQTTTDCAMHEMTSCGHVPFRDQPARTSSLIKQFLLRVAA